MAAVQISPRKPQAAPDEIATALETIVQSLKGGATVAVACAEAGVAVPTYYRWLRRKKGRDGQIGRNSRSAIIAAAKARFFAEGLDATLEDVAADAGVARQTVYNQFGSKQALFKAVVLEVHSKLMADMPRIVEGDDIHATLTTYGQQMAKVGLDSEAIALFRVAIAEFRRLPDLGRTSFDLRESHALPKVTHHLADYLATIGNWRDSVTDPAMVSEIFYGAVVGFDRNRLLAGLPGSSAEQVARRIEAAARFLVQYISVA